MIPVVAPDGRRRTVRTVVVVIGLSSLPHAACSGEPASARRSASGAGGTSPSAGGTSATGGSGGAGGATAGTGGTGVIGLDSGAGAAPGPDGGCGSVELDAQVETVVTPGNVLVVFDQSLSMGAAELAGLPKWRAASDALVAAVTPLQNELNLGAIFFPGLAGFNLCGGVEPITGASNILFQAGPQFIAKWQQKWAAATLNLGTPLDDAMAQADAALLTSGLAGETAVVVFTDGQPTCPQPKGAVAWATEWLARGIRTYVVGLPGAAAAPILNDIAVAGGTGSYILPANPAQLEAELDQIAATTVKTSIADCVLNLDPPPPNPDEIFVVVTETSTGADFSVPEGADGWELSPDGKTVTLVGTSCDDAKAGRFAKISIRYGCVDLPPLPK